ncbi:MAG: DUF4952 domain-containing protein [Cyanobacteria bacterium P01_G01_bin.54]
MFGSLLGCSGVTSKATRHCPDYLAQWQLKPEPLALLNCRLRPQVDDPSKLTARYMVVGAHAAAVEDFLYHEFGMTRLDHICCNWHGYPPGSYRDAAGQDYLVSMYSVETLLQQRAEWSQIPFFGLR